MRLATYIRVLERALRKGEPACSVAEMASVAEDRSKYRVLVTGFGPYGNTQINPSLAVVNALKAYDSTTPADGLRGPPLYRDGTGYEIVARQVSCKFNKCIEEASAFVDELEPNAVIMLGEYPGRAMVTVERVAINYNDSTRYGVCDEAGYAPQGTKVVEDGPAAYLSTPVWKSSPGAPCHRRDVVPVHTGQRCPSAASCGTYAQMASRPTSRATPGR